MQNKHKKFFFDLSVPTSGEGEGSNRLGQNPKFVKGNIFGTPLSGHGLLKKRPFFKKKKFFLQTSLTNLLNCLVWRRPGPKYKKDQDPNIKKFMCR